MASAKGARSFARNVLPERLLSGAALTPREQRILREIVVGHSSKEVARALEISPRTVEFHRANLLRKLDAKNTADLVRKVSDKSSTKR